MMMYGNHMSTGGWIFAISATIVVIALVVAAAVWLASSRRTSSAADALAWIHRINGVVLSGEVA